VRYAVVEDSVLQGLGDQPLADHLLEELRPILAGNDLVRHRNFGFWISDFGFATGMSEQEFKDR